MSRRTVLVETVACCRPQEMAQNRAREANLITAGLAVLCGLACVCGLVPAVEQAAASSLGVAGVVVALFVVLRWVVRRVHIHFEDLEDARAAAIWCAAHAEAASTDSTSGLPARAA